MTSHDFDWEREARTAVAEAVLAEGKSTAQIAAILAEARERAQPLLLTRLAPGIADALIAAGFALDYHGEARVAVFGTPPQPAPGAPRIGIVTAGTSDLPVAEEARIAARFMGLDTVLYADCGVAGLHRLTGRIEQIRTHPLLIAVAGMEGALFSVLAGLVAAPVIAVPRSAGYGVAAGGRVALEAALTSCAPGVLTVNIDNGFGAAASARKIITQMRAHDR